MLTYIKQHLSKFEAQFTRKLSNTEKKDEKKCVAYKKRVIQNPVKNLKYTFLQK